MNPADRQFFVALKGQTRLNILVIAGVKYRKENEGLRLF